MRIIHTMPLLVRNEPLIVEDITMVAARYFHM